MAQKNRKSISGPFSAKKTMDYKWVKMSKFGSFEKFELNIPSCRVFYGLSENHKIIDIGQS